MSRKRPCTADSNARSNSRTKNRGAQTDGVRRQRAVFHLRIILALMMFVLVFLGGRLWCLQILHADRYRAKAEHQSVRWVHEPAPRGTIYDRHGVCLAENRPRYCIALNIKDFHRSGRWERTAEHVMARISELGQVLGLAPVVTVENILRHIRTQLPLPFVAWRDVSATVVARWAEASRDFPGVDIHVEQLRRYNMGPLAAHVLGYVGTADPADNTEPEYHFRLRGDMTGRCGIEQACDEVLSGASGRRFLRINASGFAHEARPGRAARPGRSVILSLDVRVQQLAENVLTGRRGAVVVLDPWSGEVLALASAPAFDPNSFVQGISHREWQLLSTDEGKPFLHRAVAGTYPAGSIFKPVVALAALHCGQATEATIHHCFGYYQVGGIRFRCWQRWGHGDLDMRMALSKSCNPYFCRLAVHIGHEHVHRMAASFGLGSQTGIDLSGEQSGILPDAHWKRNVHKRGGWSPGDTCNLAMGQGYLTVTPLQMAVVAATIANGGHVFRPRIILQQGGEFAATVQSRRKPDPVRRLGVARNMLNVVREGMLGAVEDRHGTAREAAVPGIRVAAKTGTAQFGVDHQKRKHTWTIAYAPFEMPRYAVAMVIEDGDSGGHTVAPRVGELLRGIFGEHSVEKTVDVALRDGRQRVVSP